MIRFVGMAMTGILPGFAEKMAYASRRAAPLPGWNDRRPRNGDRMSHPAIRDYLRAAAVETTAGRPTPTCSPGSRRPATRSAFELLVWRHAALVQRVCRAVLRDHHAAEDAAQATFLVLARKAHTFAGRGSVVGWLYRVARRVAVRLAKQRRRLPASSADLDRVPAATPEPAARPTNAAAAVRRGRPAAGAVPRAGAAVLLRGADPRGGGPPHRVAGRHGRRPAGAGEGAARPPTVPPRASGSRPSPSAVPAGSFVGPTAQAAAAFAAACSVVPGVRSVRPVPRRRSDDRP